MTLRIFSLVILLLLCNNLNIFSLDYSSKRFINVQSFGVSTQKIDEDESIKYDRWKKIKNAFFYCINNGYDLYFPPGIYDVGQRNFPFRSDLSSNKLLNCKGITIFGDGNSTVFMTSSVNGADVLQLNKIENLTIKNIVITAIQTGFKRSGSNGISITYGWNNIVLENITCFDLPGVNKGTWIDGGKALTIQFGNDQLLKKGSIKANNVVSINNAYGFRFDGSHINELLRWEPDISINIYVKRAFQGVSISFGSASDFFNSDHRLKMNINAKLIDCQQSIIMARVIGGNYTFQLDKTISYNDVLNNNTNQNWVSNDKRVFAYLAQAPKYVNVNISGNTGLVDRMIWIGAIGNIKEPYNYLNQTENSKFKINIIGLAELENISIIEDTEGYSLFNTEFYINKDIIKKNPFKEFSPTKRILLHTTE